MKASLWRFVSLLLLICGSVSGAQTAKPTAQRSASQEINEWVSASERELVAMAEDMPEDKYKFAPTNGEFRGVRNFGKQVKHAAAAMQLISATVLGDPIPPDAADERGPDSARTKSEVMKYLKDSFDYLRKAVASIDENNAFELIKNPFGQGQQTRIGLITLALVHSSNHYGQMVEYLRMNGLKPRGSH
ncbi:MAG: DinB family protein [Acidobacteriota bacterium]